MIFCSHVVMFFESCQLTTDNSRQLPTIRWLKCTLCTFFLSQKLSIASLGWYLVPSAGFVDAFMDLVLYINTCPPGTPITVEWNKNLPRYVSTGESQVFKAFTDLPNDLPFAYGSLTASHTSLRPWLGPKNTSAFHVPGMEFFATTGEYKNETE